MVDFVIVQEMVALGLNPFHNHAGKSKTITQEFLLDVIADDIQTFEAYYILSGATSPIRLRQFLRTIRVASTSASLASLSSRGSALMTGRAL